jgi:hypothetical protein
LLDDIAKIDCTFNSLSHKTPGAYMTMNNSPYLKKYVTYDMGYYL